MSIIRSFRPFTHTLMDMNAVANRLMSDPFFRSLDDSIALRRDPSIDGDMFTPRIDVWDTGDSIKVQADLPGVPKENVSCEINNGNLHISGQTSDSNEYDQFNSHVRERRYGTFSRVISLPQSIDESLIKAEFKNGVLEMNIPKKLESQPKKITVA